ncbi:MAG: hypothetical protein GF409_02740 [Candidatus Omnitrophica bacterium]|nr:hypothetical protein [Candidatus Omnitrophota bacterium]
MRSTKIHTIIAASIALAMFSGCSRPTSASGYSRVEPLLGTFVQIKIQQAVVPEKKLEEAAQGAMRLARSLEEKYSSFDPESEVNELNSARQKRVSPQLFQLISEAQRIGALTGGQFDITVSPVLKADGFYRNMPKEILDQIPDDYTGVGWDNIVIDQAAGTVKLLNGAWIDLSGIAKGYIVDRMVEYLRGRGLRAVMVNAGGDLYCGSREDAGPWKIGVRSPKGRTMAVTLQVENSAVATSGDYENVVLEGRTGKVLSHLIDPHSDRALDEKYSSVTVIAPTCMEADALSTGMMVMGPERAVKLAERLEGIEIITVSAPEGRQKVKSSEGAEKYMMWR